MSAGPPGDELLVERALLVEIARLPPRSPFRPVLQGLLEQVRARRIPKRAARDPET